MKFEKRPPASQPTSLSSDDIAAANRFEERRARIEAERRGPFNREMSRRVSALFDGLIGHLSAKPNYAPRWLGQRESAMPLTIEEMAELWGKNPVKLSEEALNRAILS
jgi:hypothetical protein